LGAVGSLGEVAVGVESEAGDAGFGERGFRREQQPGNPGRRG
jgi:hypothetical protein